MGILANTAVSWSLSPRIITIDAAFTEVTVTDIHETLLDLEDSVEGMIHPHLRNTSGGEALGGGVTVGVTVELQNAQVAFQERTTPLESGTATSNATVGSDNFITLTDTAATFQTNNVGRGDLVINVTDGSQATVVEVLSETQIKMTGLTGGTDNDWDINDVYDVYDVVQCRVTDGNLVAVDNLAAELSPIFPTFGTQVITTASSSATTSNQAALEHATFNGHVTLDETSSYTGTEFPNGSDLQPVNNLTDAKAIATARGFSTIVVKGDYTFLASDTIDGYTLEGESVIKSNIVLTQAATITNCNFQTATISGQLDGGTTIEDCDIGNLIYVDGVVQNCRLQSGVIVLGGTAASFINCQSGPDRPTIDMGGSGTELVVREFSGELLIINHTSGVDEVSVDINSGHITLDTSVTAGDYTIRGLGKLTDNSIGAAVNSDDLINKALLTDITNLVQEVQTEALDKASVSKAVWETDLIDIDEDETAGAMLLQTAETVESKIEAKGVLAKEIWEQDLSEVFEPNSAGGLLKKLNLIYKILVH